MSGKQGALRSAFHWLVRIAGLVALAAFFTGFDPRKLALMGACIFTLAGIVWIRRRVVPPCAYCGSRTCSHHLDPVKGHPFMGWLYDDLESCPEIRAAAADTRLFTERDVLVRDDADPERYREAFVALARLYPSAALAVMRRARNRVRAVMRVEDLVPLLAATERRDRVRAVEMLEACTASRPVHAARAVSGRQKQALPVA